MPETEAPHSSEGPAHELAEGAERVRQGAADLAEKGQDLLGTIKSRPVIIAAVAAGATAAALIGIKIAYDRRKSSKGYRSAVRQLEDARDALVAAASDLPERSRAVVHRVTHR